MAFTEQPPKPLPFNVAIADPKTGLPTPAFLTWWAQLSAYLARLAAAVP